MQCSGWLCSGAAQQLARHAQREHAGNRLDRPPAPPACRPRRIISQRSPASRAGASPPAEEALLDGLPVRGAGTRRRRQRLRERTITHGRHAGTPHAGAARHAARASHLAAAQFRRDHARRRHKPAARSDTAHESMHRPRDTRTRDKRDVQRFPAVCQGLVPPSQHRGHCHRRKPGHNGAHRPRWATCIISKKQNEKKDFRLGTAHHSKTPVSAGGLGAEREECAR